MAAADPEPMDLSKSEGNLFEQDRKRFKPLKAIRRMFRGKKKSKEFSQSMMALPSTSEGPHSVSDNPAFLRSLSHESVFAKEGIISSAVPGGVGVKHALSLGDVADVTVPIDRLKGADEPDAAKSMSFGSDVNKSSHASQNNDDLDLNMNDIVVNVSRLNNKAAYDKIALRPKRRPARNARGTQQQHVIRVEAQVNGFVDEDVPIREDGDAKEDSARDISPPRAKKARPPTFVLPTSTQQDEDESRPASSEGASSTPKRFSMLGRSPVGPGPGMIVPSLEDVKNIKLRKRQTDGKTKEPEEAVKKTPEKTQPPPEKPKGAKKLKETKKSSKQEQKGNSESSSSIFSWKKSASPKSPRAAKKSTDSSKENEKPKSLFPSLKSSKKTTPEKESKVSGAARFFSSSDKKDNSKKKGILSGKREKNHSENNSKSPDEAPMEGIEEGRKKADIPEVKVQDSVPVSPEIEKLDIFTDKTDETSLLDQINAAMSERKNETGGKRESSGSKYAEKLKLQAQNLAESRVAEQEKSPKSPTPPIGSKRRVIVEGNKITVSADVEKAKKAEVGQPAHAEPKSPDSVETPTRKTAAGPSSPTGVEKPSASPFKKTERAPSHAASKRPKSPVKETPRSSSPSIVATQGAKATSRPLSGSDEDKKAARPSSPPVAEKPKKLSFKKPERLPSGMASNHPKSPSTKSPAQTHSVTSPIASVENSTSPVKETKPRVFSFGKADKAATKGATSLETVPVVEVTTPSVKERHAEKASRSPKEEISPSSLPVVSQSSNSGESKSPVASPSSTETRSVRFASQNEEKSSDTAQVTQNEPDVQSAKESVKSEKSHADQAKPAELTQKSGVEVPPVTAQEQLSKTRARREVGQKPHSFDNDVDIEAKEDKEQQPEEKGLRNRSLSARSATEDDSPSGLYSRTNLKPVGGDNLLGRRSASVRISPISSPSRASRPKSFHIKSARSNSEISTQKEQKSEIEPEKTKPISPLTKPSPTKEKPKTAEKPKSPTKSPSRPSSIKTLMQDAENNNVKDPEATEKKDTKKTTPVSDQPVSRRRNSKQTEEKADDGAPAWVQMARRRSKVWEDGSYKTPRTTPQHTPSTEDPGKSDNRSRGTSAPSKPLSVSRDKSPAKSEDRSGKNDYRSRGTSVPSKQRSYSTDKPSAKTEDRTGKKDDRSKVTSVPSKLRATSTDKTPPKTEDRQVKNENRPKVTSSIQSKPRSFSTEKTPAKTEDRPKTLPVTGGKPRSDSTTKTPKSETPAKSSPLTPSSKVQYNRTASIPAINAASPRKPNPSSPKEVTPSGQPSWLAIAMQKQKNWAKEETV